MKYIIFLDVLSPLKIYAMPEIMSAENTLEQSSIDFQMIFGP
jgi:hypothetical protein